MARLPVIQITPPYDERKDLLIKGPALEMIGLYIRRGRNVIQGSQILQAFVQNNKMFDLLAGDVIVVRCRPRGIENFLIVGNVAGSLHFIGDPKYRDYPYNLANLSLQLVLKRDENNEDIVLADWVPFTGVKYEVFVKYNEDGNPEAQGKSGTALKQEFEFGYVVKPGDVFKRVMIKSVLKLREGLNNPHGDAPRVAALLYKETELQGRQVNGWNDTFFIAGSAIIPPNNPGSALRKTSKDAGKPVVRLIRTPKRMPRIQIAQRVRLLAARAQSIFQGWIRQIAARQHQLMGVVGVRGMAAFRMAARRAYAATRVAEMLRLRNFQPMSLVGPPSLIRNMAVQELSRMGTAVGRAAGDAQGLGQRIQAMAQEIRGLRRLVEELQRISNQLRQAPHTANQYTRAGLEPSDRKGGKGSGSTTGGTGGTGGDQGGDGGDNGGDTTTKTDVKITDLWYEPFAFGSGLIIVLGDTDKQIEADMEDGLLTIKLNDNITDLREKRFTSEDDRLNNPRLFFFKKGTPPPGIQSFRPEITSQNSNKYNFIINTETRVFPMSNTISRKIKSNIIDDISIQLVGNTNLVQVTITLSKQCDSSASAFENNVQFKSERSSQYHSMSSVAMTRSGRSIEFRGNVHEDIISGIVLPGRLFIKFSNAAAVFQSDDYPIPDFYNNFDIQCRKLTDRY
jgi:hypothetical protein